MAICPAKPYDALLFAAGAAVASLVLVAFTLSPTSQLKLATLSPTPADIAAADPPAPTFYDDPSVGYTVEKPISNWDARRREWLRLHPAHAAGGRQRVLMVSGSQPAPCRGAGGDHFLLRLLKNKLDYCRRHGIKLFYNDALLQPAMFSFWAKIPVVRAAMVAHPEAEWIWWVDADAVITDMDFALPLDRYAGCNLVVHGWPDLIFGENPSWVALNAGVFLIRNCAWAVEFLDKWASTGPASPEYGRWGKLLKSTFKDKLFPESDDQSALVYLLLTKDKLADKIFIENEYFFQGYWLDLVGELDNMTARYEEAARTWPPALRRRHAEVVAADYGAARERLLMQQQGRRPFVTHFTGCQPCSGEHNKVYSAKSCDEGMRRALNFADDQVLRSYGFRHVGPLSRDVVPAA